MHYWNWFDIAFPWIGGVGAIVLVVLLFATDRLRSDPSRSRWHDWVWLSWLGVVAYLLHNFEEYGIDLLGTFHAFPGMICAQLGLQPYPNCPIPPVFFLAVNITAFWIAAPLAALLSRRHPLVGLSVYGIMMITPWYIWWPRLGVISVEVFSLHYFSRPWPCGSSTPASVQAE